MTTKSFVWIITALSIINLVKEFLLSRHQVVSYDYKKDIIRTLITLLMDAYRWKASCRATLFIPDSNFRRLTVYDRINAGRGPDDSQQKCFFRMKQGIPGKAWEHAWDGIEGDECSNLVASIQVGNVPEQALRKKDDLRKYFKEKFQIEDNDIYDSLGKGKFTIRSYMSIGILGRHNTLVAVLSIDSELPDQFTDFEQLLKLRSGGVMKSESGVAIIGDNREGDACFPKDAIPFDFDEFDKIRKGSLVQGEPKEAKERFQRFAMLARMVEQKRVPMPAPAFLFALGWTLKQVREIFTESA